MTEHFLATEIKQCILELLSGRTATASICPSEVARAFGNARGQNWRDLSGRGKVCGGDGLLRLTTAMESRVRIGRIGCPVPVGKETQALGPQGPLQ